MHRSPGCQRGHRGISLPLGLDASVGTSGSGWPNTTPSAVEVEGSREPRWEPPGRTIFVCAERIRTTETKSAERANWSERLGRAFGYLRIRRLEVRIPPAALAVLARAPSTSRPSRSGEHPAREDLGHTLMGDQLGDDRQEQHETPADSGGLHSPGPGMSQQATTRLKTGRSSGGVLSDDLAL